MNTQPNNMRGGEQKRPLQRYEWTGTNSCGQTYTLIIGMTVMVILGF